LPLIEVELKSEKQVTSTIGLIDSGATLTFIPYEIADILELVPNEPLQAHQISRVQTAGGIANFLSVKIRRLSVLHKGSIFSDFNNFTVYFPYASEVEDRYKVDLPYAILGRDSIFKRFVITFLEKRSEFELIYHKGSSK